MKPAPFAYFDPESLDEALQLLAEHGEDAKIIAGGQTLGPLLNMRMATPAVIVDINRIAALGERRRETDGTLVLGALTRQSSLEDDRALSQTQPLIAAAIPHIAHRAIRNRGTVAGSLAHADPAAEWTGLVTALEAGLVLQRSGGQRRTVQARDFFLGPLTTVIEPQEMLTEIRIPVWPAGSGWSFIEFNRRHGDFALTGVLVCLSLDHQGCCKEVRVALIGVEETPVRAVGAEALLKSARPSQDLLAQAASKAASDVAPISDLHASSDYRRHLVGELTRRALAQAVERARVQ